MVDIFISYANEDRSTAERIANQLSARGWSVWWDRDLTPGREYTREIEEVLTGAKCVVVIWSRYSTASRWVQDEAREGLERGILVPVRIDQSQIPLGFRGVQTADLSEWLRRPNHRSFKQFTAAVAALVDSRQPVKASTPRRRPDPSGRSTAARWAFLALAVAVSVAGYYLFNGPGGDNDESEPRVMNTEPDDLGTTSESSTSELTTPPAAWGTTSWHPVENSHQLAPWCPPGSFLVAFDIDDVPSWDPQDSPRMASAQCATLAAASSSAWEDSFTVTVGVANSHNRQADWCPEGTYLIGLDQDRTDEGGPTYGDGDAPIIGRALCGRPSRSPYTSSEFDWRNVGPAESLTPSGPWCPDGAFITRFDLDGGADGYTYPIVGAVECERPT